MVSRFAETNTQMDSIMSQIQDKLAIARHSGKDIEVKVRIDLRSMGPCEPLPQFSRRQEQQHNFAAAAPRSRRSVSKGRSSGRRSRKGSKKECERESLKRLAGQGEDQPTEVNRGPRGWDWGQPSKVDSQTTIYENASIVEKNNTTPPPPPPPIKSSRKNDGDTSDSASSSGSSHRRRDRRRRRSKGCDRQRG